MSEQQIVSVGDVTSPPNRERRHKYERDLTRIFCEEGLFETASHGFRIRLRVVMREGEFGTYRLILPLRLERIHFDDGKLIVDEVLYSLEGDGRSLLIPLARLTGRGPAFPGQERYCEEELELLSLMERVVLAGLAWSVREFVDDTDEIVPVPATH